ncbi:hypothetical protein [Dorea sp. AM58-8]|uniref:hypothetical protein n=1 Tax=Dorea sp. AM58-8 TaxID=2292346 RepID=UPI000E51DE51|nr:hypothetical protein [Dorea sp. AM58-8]RGY81069.1 hypothetical protein DXA18_07815 [Dorea sp. AM58-8]
MINQEMKKIIYKIVHNAQKSDERRQEKTRHEDVVLLPFGMSLRGFCCSAVLYTKLGECFSQRRKVYMNWSLPGDHSWGK